MITTKQIISLEKLDPVQGHDSESVQIARLIAFTKGINPANDAKVVELLNMPLKAYRREGKEVFDLLSSLTDVVYDDAGGATVGEIVLRPLLGSDLMALADTNVPDLIRRLTGMSQKKLVALEPHDYLALAKAVNFLAEDALSDVSSSE